MQGAWELPIVSGRRVREDLQHLLLILPDAMTAPLVSLNIISGRLEPRLVAFLSAIPHLFLDRWYQRYCKPQFPCPTCIQNQIIVLLEKSCKVQDLQGAADHKKVVLAVESGGSRMPRHHLVDNVFYPAAYSWWLSTNPLLVIESYSYYQFNIAGWSKCLC